LPDEGKDAEQELAKLVLASSPRPLEQVQVQAVQQEQVQK